jgi:hypothetical protein
MTEYICEKCLKNFSNSKSHYTRHINRKKSCRAMYVDNLDILDKQEILYDKFVCEYCNLKFVKKYNLNRHLQKCKNNLKIDNSFNKIVVEKLNEKIDEKIHEKLNHLIKQNNELKKENIELKKKNNKNKNNNNFIIDKYEEKDKKQDIHIILNQNIINNNQNNIISFNNMNLQNVDKNLFINPIMNTRLFGKEIILKMIENIYINENLPEYQNIMITDKNRGYVKIYNNGKWKTDNIQIINLVIDGIIEHSKTILVELNQFYINNIQAKNRLVTSKKYIDLCDLEYLEELEEEQQNDEADNKYKIKRCKEFRDMVFKDTINLFHDNKNILIKPKKFNLLDIQDTI